MKKKVSEKKSAKKGTEAPTVNKEAKKKAVAKKKSPAKAKEKTPAKAAKKVPVKAKEEVAAKPKAVAKKKVVAKRKAAVPKRTVAATKTPVKQKVPKAYTEDEIRIAAFYVYEERSAMGSPGDPAGDWNEAIRRLKVRDKK